jgi:hypothetical protein
MRQKEEEIINLKRVLEIKQSEKDELVRIVES